MTNQVESLKAIDVISNIMRSNYPHLFEDPEVKVADYAFWDCKNNKEIPAKDFKDAQKLINAHNITDFSVVVYLNNNIIAYRLAI